MDIHERTWKMLVSFVTRRVPFCYKFEKIMLIENYNNVSTVVDKLLILVLNICLNCNDDEKLSICTTPLGKLEWLTCLKFLFMHYWYNQ